jgi:hypothetical protein
MIDPLTGYGLQGGRDAHPKAQNGLQAELSGKEDRGHGLVKVFQSLASLCVVLPARFEGLGFGLEFADLDQGEIISLIQYGIALGCVVGVVRFHGLPPINKTKHQGHAAPRRTAPSR